MTRKSEVLAMIKEMVDTYLPPGSYSLYLIGSQAGRSELKKADIDIMIDAGHPLSLEVMGQMLSEVEDLPTLYIIDLVDRYQTNETFQHIALSHAELI